MTPTSAASDTTAAAMREALSCFATGVTVVTSLLPDGHLIGATANSFNSVALDSPLILFNLNRRLRSFVAFNAAERFAVDILGARQKALSMQFATVMGDKWHSVRYRVGERCGCPVLDNAHVALECSKWSSYDGGDHVISVWRVLDTKVNPQVCASCLLSRPLASVGRYVLSRCRLRSTTRRITRAMGRAKRTGGSERENRR